MDIDLALAALALFGCGAAMAFYEWSRIKAKRPLFKGRQVVTLYWVAYLSCFVLGVTAGAAAFLR